MLEGLRFFFPAETFFFTTPPSVLLVFFEFVSSLINLFSCFSQQVYSRFEKEKRKRKNPKIYMNVS
jgi:hypothetical protein